MPIDYQALKIRDLQQAVNRLQAIEKPGLSAGTAFPATQVQYQRWLRIDLRTDFINVDGTATGWRQLSTAQFDTVAQVKALTNVPDGFRVFVFDNTASPKVRLELYYDLTLTLWLAITELSEPVNHNVNQATVSLSANTSPALYTSRPRSNYSIYVTRVEAEVFVQTTNNATNYWQLQLVRFDSGNAQTTLSTVDTSALSVSTQGQLVFGGASELNVLLANAQAFEFSVNYVKAGSGALPGNIFLYPTHIWYRLVA